MPQLAAQPPDLDANGQPIGVAGKPPDLDASGQPTFSTSNEKDAQGNAVVDPNTVGTFATHAIQAANPIPIGQMIPFPRAAGGAGLDAPLQVVKGFAQKQQDLFNQAKSAIAKGDYVTAGEKALTWALNYPTLGGANVLDKAGVELQHGHYAAAGGDLTGLMAAAFGPTALTKMALKVPALARNPNAAEAAAVEFGQQRGIPVDAGTATGNAAVKGLQVGAEATPGGAIATWNAKAQQAEALQRVGQQLADQSRATARTPEQAGAGLIDALGSRLEAESAYADRAYDTLRALEKDPRYQRTITTGQRTTDTGLVGPTGQPITRVEPITETMGLPVDLRGAKAALKPIYEQLTRQYSVTQQQASAGFKALGNIVSGPDFAPITQVEADLGAIKQIARGADRPELRTQSQGLAASGVSRLQAAVDRTAREAGPQVSRALDTGRASTRAKYETADALDSVRAEPVQAYRDATAPQDSGIARLRTLATRTPQAVPQIARAWLDDALGTATSDGGFDRAARLQAMWQKLGPQTKQILFPGGAQRAALDNFFLLAKKIGEQPNPSRTALVGTTLGSAGLIFTEPATGLSLTVGGAVLARMLRNPTAVKLLSKGLTLSLSAGPKVRAMGAAAVLSAARAASVHVGAAASPAVATTTSETAP